MICRVNHSKKMQHMQVKYITVAYGKTKYGLTTVTINTETMHFSSRWSSGQNASYMREVQSYQVRFPANLSWIRSDYKSDRISPDQPYTAPG